MTSFSLSHQPKSFNTKQSITRFLHHLLLLSHYFVSIGFFVNTTKFDFPQFLGFPRNPSWCPSSFRPCLVEGLFASSGSPFCPLRWSEFGQKNDSTNKMKIQWLINFNVFLAVLLILFFVCVLVLFLFLELGLKFQCLLF